MTAIPTSDPEGYGGSAGLLVESTPRGDIWFHMRGARSGVITVSPSDLVEALIGLVPGLSVTYVPPVVVPTGLGAVVNAYGLKWVRVGGVLPKGLWADQTGFCTKTDSEIAKLLSAGAEVLSEGVTL